MPRTPGPSTIFVTIGLALSGCSATPPPATSVPVGAPAAEPPAPAPPPPSTPPTPTLEERLAALESTYRAGLELLAGGAPSLAEEEIGRARAGLTALVGDCAASIGCDRSPILTVYGRLLDAQTALLSHQAVLLAEATAVLATEDAEEPGSSPFESSVPEAGAAQTMFRGTDLRQVIELNGPVEAALDDWLTWKRPLFMEAWENYQFLRPEMAPVYEEVGLPEALLFGILAQETGGKVHAVSKAGAAGPLQFMRQTGRRYGLVEQNGFDLRFDPAAAARANAEYLGEQLATVGYSLEKALAAYNGGENRMRGLQRRYGDVPLWDPRIFWSLPRETRGYVPQVLAAAWLFLHADAFGLELPTIDNLAVEVTLPNELALSELAICLGQANGKASGWFRTLRNLNPALEPGERIPVGKTVRVPQSLAEELPVRCSDDRLLSVARSLHDANYPPQPEMIRYQVAGGDTLGRIAAKFGCGSIGLLADLNGIRPPGYVIRAGQTLKIPRCR